VFDSRKFNSLEVSSLALIRPTNPVNLVSLLPIHSGPGCKWVELELDGRRDVSRMYKTFELTNRDLLKLIKSRLETLNFSDPKYPGVELDLCNVDPSVGISHSYSLGNEKFASRYMGNDNAKSIRLSHVLVNSPEQDHFVRNPLPSSSMIRFGRTVFPLHEANLLHPAQVQCYLRVSYILKRKSLRVLEALTHENIKESCLVKHHSHFALVDYYQPHTCRHTWRFANVAEVWSAKLHACSPALYRPQNLVSVDHIVGKFVPGNFEIFRAMQDAKSAKLVNYIDKTAEPAMAVIRIGIRDPLIS